MAQETLTTQIKIIDNRQRSARYAKRNKLKIKCRIEARKYPLNECCEFCGSTEHLERAHFNYNIPELFITACKQCHKWCDRKHASTYKGDRRLTLKQARQFAYHLGTYDKYFDMQGQPLDKSMYKQLKPIRVYEGDKLVEVRYE
ncbi:MAG: hypothetical protein ABSC20_06320 [Candidatus Bathyarchaeia archaeon]|jgi:hypothetical protein